MDCTKGLFCDAYNLSILWYKHGWMKKRCLAVPGTFLPYNDVTTQLVYKQLRLLPMEYDVCALNGEKEDPGFQKRLAEDPCFAKFHIVQPCTYRDATFSIHNVNLLKGLSTLNKYIDAAVGMYNGQEYLYTSSFPCYTVRVGMRLKKEYPELKWIANFSDPINHSPYKYDIPTIRSYYPIERECFYLYCHFYVVDQDEADAFENADLLLFICEEQRDFMIEQYMKYFHRIDEEQLRRKCVIVPLSYIPEWNTPVEKDPAVPSDTFTLAHFGRIYGLRIIEEFLYAFFIFVKEHPDRKIQIEQYGEFRRSDRRLIQRLGIQDYFILHDKFSYEAGFQKMSEADAVLLFDTIMPEDEIQPYLPSKVLEYSLLKKNVLAVATRRSPTYRLMKQTDAVVCRYDRHDILRGLEDIILHGKTSRIDYCHTNEKAVKELKDRLEEWQ